MSFFRLLLKLLFGIGWVLVGVDFFIGLDMVLVGVVGLDGMLVLVFFSMVSIWFLEVGYKDKVN